MKEKTRLPFYPLIVFVLGAMTMISSCATFEQQQSVTFISPFHEILYGTASGLKDFPSPKDTGLFTNTRWRIRDINPRFEGIFRGTELSFERSGIMVESAELPNGTIYTDTHRYRVVGSTLVLTKDGNTTAALFTIEGNTLRLDVGHYILTFDRVDR